MSFDSTLLYLLLRSICNLPTPTAGWNNPPAPTSTNREDDIVRIKLYRNELYGHTAEPALSDADFNQHWDNIASVLLRLGGAQTDIDDLKVASMDPVDATYYIKCLEERDKNDERIMKALEATEMRIAQKMDEVHRKLVEFEKMDELHRKLGEFESTLQASSRATVSDTSVQDIPMEPARKLEKPTDYTSQTIRLTIDQSGRYYDFSKDGFCLEIPPHTVSQTTEVVCKVSENYVPSPLEQFESLVSSVVQFELTNVIVGKSINFALMHSGLTIGHDTFVKAYDEDNHEWKRITEYEHSSLKRDHWKIPCIVVQMDKLTTIAVVTKVIIPVDTFEVPTSGCLIKSSVCPDVTICFPEASVDKAIKGRLKVIPMPKYFPVKVEEFPCPLLLVDGFKGIRFSKFVTIQMPHPCPERYPVGQVRLMRLEDDEWSDVTDNTVSFLCDEKESTIEIRVKHFSGLWVWLYGVPLNSFRYIHEHLCLARQIMCFAAFKGNDQLTLCPKITVKCANITKQKDMDKKTGCGYTRLALKTVKEGMRPNTTAHVKIDGGFERNADVQKEDVYLEDEISSEDVQTKPKADSTGIMIVSFYERYSNNTTLLCTLTCNETAEAARQPITTASSEGFTVPKAAYSRVFRDGILLPDLRYSRIFDTQRIRQVNWRCSY